MSKPLFIVFTPLPPARSGIADYNAELHPHLSEHGDILYVVADSEQPNVKLSSSEIIHYSDFRAHQVQSRSAIRYYHIGNSEYHKFILAEALVHPGIMVMHDYLIHHLISELTLSTGDFEAYARFLFYDVGRPGLKIARHRQIGIFTEYQKFLYPLNQQVLDNAVGVITHSRFMVDEIRRLRPYIPICHIPLHLGSLPVALRGMTQQVARQRLNLPQDELIIVSLGHITPPKQIQSSLRALATIRSAIPRFRYILVGAPYSEEIVRQWIAGEGLDDCVTITGYTDLTTFHVYLLASDIVINLRYPNAGETSAALVRALGLGKPAIVYDYASFQDFPAEAIVKIPLDTQHVAPLAEAIRLLAVNPDHRERVGREAQRYASREHSPAKCAKAYADAPAAFSSAGSGWSPPLAKRAAFFGKNPFTPEDTARFIQRRLDALAGTAAYASCKALAHRLASALARLPAGVGRLKLLELGGSVETLDILANEFRYAAVVGTDFNANQSFGEIPPKLCAYSNKSYPFWNFSVEAERFPFSDGEFDVVLCCEPIERLSDDPMFAFAEINRVLKHDGMLLLTTPNLMSGQGSHAGPTGGATSIRMRSTTRRMIEYSEDHVRVLFEAAGFCSIQVETEDSSTEPSADVMQKRDEFGYPMQMNGDNIIATGRKGSPNIERYPSEIYG